MTTVDHRVTLTLWAWKASLGDVSLNKLILLTLCFFPLFSDIWDINRNDQPLQDKYFSVEQYNKHNACLLSSKVVTLGCARDTQISIVFDVCGAELDATFCLYMVIHRAFQQHTFSTE